MITRREFMSGSAALAALPFLDPEAVRAGEPILTLQGHFDKAESNSRAQSSLGDLDALPQTAFSTTTPWHQGVVKFSGVALKDYMAAFGARAKSIRMVALNDYSVDGEVADLVAAGALLATRQNDQPMPVSDKGPVFLVFPFDSRSELQHQTYYSRAVWQLTEIDILA